MDIKLLYDDWGTLDLYSSFVDIIKLNNSSRFTAMSIGNEIFDKQGGHHARTSVDDIFESKAPDIVDSESYTELVDTVFRTLITKYFSSKKDATLDQVKSLYIMLIKNKLDSLVSSININSEENQSLYIEDGDDSFIMNAEVIKTTAIEVLRDKELAIEKLFNQFKELFVKYEIPAELKEPVQITKATFIKIVNEESALVLQDKILKDVFEYSNELYTELLEIREAYIKLISPKIKDLVLKFGISLSQFKRVKFSIHEDFQKILSNLNLEIESDSILLMLFE